MLAPGEDAVRRQAWRERRKRSTRMTFLASRARARLTCDQAAARDWWRSGRVSRSRAWLPRPRGASRSHVVRGVCAGVRGALDAERTLIGVKPPVSALSR